MLYLLMTHLLMTLALQAEAPPRAAEVADMLREVGGPEALRALDADPALWRAVVQGVASGGVEWLQLGRELRRYSAAGMSEMLDLALAEALAPAAEAVLEIADGTVWQVGDACGTIGFAERGASDGAYIASFLDSRSGAVARVERPDLVERRDACLERIARAREDLLGDPAPVSR